MRKFISVFSLTLLLFASSVSAKDVPSAGEMIFDIMPVRPLALFGTGLGIVFFVVGGPLYFLSPNPKQTAKQSFFRLVGYPAQYTFQRPLGDFPGYMETKETVEE